MGYSAGQHTVLWLYRWKRFSTVVKYRGGQWWL